MSSFFQEGKGVVPVFPLPNVILYPKALLPLHVFEPRYLEMVRDALEGDRQIVMALLQPGWEDDYFGRPTVYSLAGLGEIVHWDKMAKGKFNILLRGTSRVQIVEEFGGGPYRIAQIKLLEETNSSWDDMENAKRKLLYKFRRIAEDAGTVPHNVELGHLIDIVTIALPIEVYRKQAIFELLDLRKRLEKLFAVIEEVLQRKQEFRRLHHMIPKDARMN